MNRYILIRRLRGPAFLLLVGVNALLAQRGILGWGQSWPFFMILIGVLMLAERAALASEGYPPPPPWPGPGANQPPYPGVNAGTNLGSNQGSNQASNPGATSDPPAQGGGLRVTPTSTTAIPSPWEELEKKKEGGQS
jgi:hypothetical protein